VSSTTPDQPADPTPDAPQAADERAEEHLLVDPGRVRRAPRYGAFFTVGAVVGVVAGLWLGLWLVDQVAASPGDGPPVLKPGVFVTVILLATTTVTLVLAGLAAVVADRRSLRRR
jgi:hypothetical protein